MLVKMVAPVTHVLPFTKIRRQRLLPVPGKVVVRKGQQVEATDTVAEANLAPNHLLLDLARGLGVPANKTDEYLQVREGAQLSEGDIIAGPVGLTRRLVRSPLRGRVALVGGGQVLIETQNELFMLKAAIPGAVQDLYADRGVLIETAGALVQGVWGNGGVDYGMLTVITPAPDQPLRPDQLDVSLRGSITLAGYLNDPEVLKTAGELPLRGLILSSMDPNLKAYASRQKLPVVVIEGFGCSPAERPMNAAAFKLLSTNERRDVALNAETWDPYAGTRPEVVIPLPSSGELPLPRETEFFATGQQVRVVRPPAVTKIGALVDLPGVVVFPSGVRALGAEVRLEDGSTQVLPLANLEVLE